MVINNDFRKIVNNWISLTLLQAGNYVVPLILTPYLIINLGIESFGLLSFALALNVFFRALVSYGFDLTGTKLIAEFSSNSVKVSEIFQDIIFSKISILVLCFLSLIGLLSIVPTFQEQKYLLLAFFTLVIADALFPVWLYQGMQNMREITIFKLSGRFSYVALTMYFVNDSNDIIYVPLIEGFIAIIISIMSLFWGVRKFSLTLKLPTLSRVISMLKSSWHVFISKVAVLFYTRFNVILLGMLTNPIVVGYYSVAENIYMAIRAMFNPIIQAIFPYLSKSKTKDPEKYKRLVRLSFCFVITSLCFLSALLYLIGPYILVFLTDSHEGNIQSILSIFSICLIFSVGGFLSTILIIEGKMKTLSKVTGYTVIVNLILIYPLTVNFGAWGVSVCFLIVQIFHFIMQLFFNRGVLKK
ncbi:hypothetical protein OAW_01810 [Vibrio cyclitrophicus ZF170]|uniref:oligosaccharide flippase family protein n=1 Tax=Vibrio cyclitrophicus TaxID=47951 RepID=UPI00031E6E6B|nr:oligosaccharide flippase family protein [Vibrio cyclitrophicus]OBT04371.1 hypothetical protein A9265_17475 [Vibrio cyclitrophicus]OEE23113.1 hypothetical protein OAW_01810 [Vibrio cyclitrophicus ZF170]